MKFFAALSFLGLSIQVQGFFEKDFKRGPKTESFPRAGISLKDNGVQIGLRQIEKIKALGIVLAKETVCVFV